HREDQPRDEEVLVIPVVVIESGKVAHEPRNRSTSSLQSRRRRTSPSGRRRRFRERRPPSARFYHERLSSIRPMSSPGTLCSIGEAADFSILPPIILHRPA